MSDAKANRVTWVDLARGVGILLVVIGHAAGGIIDSPLGSHATVMRWVFLTIYTFHMPLFFILAGLFVAERLAANPKKFISGTFTKIARAYFTWAIIQFSVIYMMGNTLNHPATGPYLPQLISIIWQPVSQFWFLYALFFMQIFAWLVVPKTGPIGFFAISALIYVALQVFGIPKWADTPPVGEFCTFVISFGIGVAIGPRLPTLKVLKDPSPLVPIALAVAWVICYGLAFLYVTHNAGPDWITKDQGAEIAFVANGWVFYPAALAGTAAVIFACCANVIPLRKAFEYLGKNSMPIFLTHILFIAGARIIVLKFVPHIDVTLLTVMVSIVGIAGSLVFLEAAKRVKIAKALALV